VSHERYEMVVGLEVHVQLRTKTKAFCRCATSFGDPPNQNTCPVCLGLPGALPVLNATAVELAVRAASALGCRVNEHSIFARKNYFYPDLPKGYQISQFDRPLAEHGGVIVSEGRRIGITRIHMEEDAGKSVHDRFPGFTAIDLNRAGVPLIEIVSEPDIRSTAETGVYLRLLREALVYADVSDCSMEQGSFRVDANVSARLRGETAYRTRTEIKNVNSFAFVERAIELEFERHCRIHDAGQAVVQQTMLYDANDDEVRPARSKEDSHDYRYFPDPDLPPLVVDDAMLSRARASVGEAPTARRARWQQGWGVSPADSAALSAERELADYFESVVALGADASIVANWVLGEVLAARNAGRGAAAFISPQRLEDLIGLVRQNLVSHTAAKTIYASMISDPAPPRVIAERDGLLQVSDDSALLAWVDEVLAENADVAKRLAAGEQKLLGVLVGKAMAKSKGRGDPKKLSQLIAERAGK
jgi:aspartyl-tRNA(Asn)/glutamyl-tRNA(Gln) amidotransferase subunit B